MLKHVLTAVLAVSVLAGCGKSESTSGGGGSTGGGSAGGGSTGGGGAPSAKTPDKFFDGMKEAMLKGDSNALWGMFSTASQKWFVKSMGEMKESTKDVPDENLAKIAEGYGLSLADFKAADGEKLAKAMLAHQSKDEKEREKMTKSSFVKADIQGDKAFCEMKEHDGSPEFIVLVKEGGDWKFDVEQSQEYDKKKKSDGGK